MLLALLCFSAMGGFLYCLANRDDIIAGKKLKKSPCIRAVIIKAEAVTKRVFNKLDWCMTDFERIVATRSSLSPKGRAILLAFAVIFAPLSLLYWIYKLFEYLIVKFTRRR
jgi:hypothetical protein